MSTNWKNTEKALASFQEELKCDICHLRVEDPIRYGACGDFFCRECVDRSTGVCPLCGVHSRTSEVTPDETVTKLLTGWKMLAAVVNAQKFGVEPFDGNSSAASPKDVPVRQKNTPVAQQSHAPKQSKQASSKNAILKNVFLQEKRVGQETTPVAVEATVVQDSSHLPETVDSCKQPTATESVDGVSSACGSGIPTRLQESVTPKAPKPPKDLMKRNHQGETPLHAACHKGNIPQLTSLLAAGANPNTKDNAGWTPLHDAVNKGFTEIVQLLLNAETLVDVPGVDNMTPLHEAVVSCRTDLVRMLVRRGANPDARISTGKTVREVAVLPEVIEAFETPVASDVLLNRERSNFLPDVEPMLCTVGFGKTSKKALTSIASSLALRIVQNFSNEVTHVIVATDESNICPPSLEVLSAMLCGCWIVNRDWLSVSQESKELVDPAPFEIGGMTGYVGDAPKRGRLNAWKMLPKLFNGLHFFLLPTAEMKLGDCLISRKDLFELICYGGGSKLSREPRPEDIPDRERTAPYHADESSDLRWTSHVILYGQSKAPQLKYNMVHIKTLSAEWLVDCIGNWKLMDPPQG